MVPRTFVLLACACLLALAAFPPSASAVTAASGPELGRSFVVSLVSGTVRVKAPGSARSVRLTGRPRAIPVGSTVNATRGKVRLVGAMTRRGGRQSGIFEDGAFRATQARRNRAVIDLKLVGGSFRGCPAQGTANAAGRRSLGRLLRGKARGRFRTRGRYAAATVRGTTWLTNDRCTGTSVDARRGKVEATAAGGTQTFVLDPGEVYEAFCSPPPEVGRLEYCLGVLSREDVGTYGFGFSTFVHEGDYTLCVAPPTGDPICKTYPIPPKENVRGFRFSTAVATCQPDRGSGTYHVVWAVPGQFLGTLPFRVTRPFPPGEGLCPVSPEELQQLQP